jgi:PIN domain nuclease of toxin-antitoxin system
VRALLDTNAFLWTNIEPDRLSGFARSFIEDSANDLVFSAVSAWEIAIKSAKRQLRLPEEPHEYVSFRIRADGLQPLPVEISHALRAGALPLIHADPFDRLLVAQSQLEGIPILTSDPNVARYEVSVIW